MRKGLSPERGELNDRHRAASEAAKEAEARLRDYPASDGAKAKLAAAYAELDAVEADLAELDARTVTVRREPKCVDPRGHAWHHDNPHGYQAQHRDGVAGWAYESRCLRCGCQRLKIEGMGMYSDIPDDVTYEVPAGL